MKIKASGIVKTEKKLKQLSRNLVNLSKEIKDLEHRKEFAQDEVTNTTVSPNQKTALLDAIMRHEYVEKATELLKKDYHMSESNINAEINKIKRKRKADKLKEERKRLAKEKIKRAIK